jgi:PBSX family phage terminase large subunit
MKRIVKDQTTKTEVDQFWHRKFNITSFLFDRQLAFVQDPSPFKVAVCSRRAGKTVACAAHLVHTAINNPNTTSLYITLTGTSGKRIIWKEFKNLLRNFKLENDAKLNEVELSVTFRNGAVIYVVGAGDSAEINKYRGLALKLVYIDECQSFKEYIKDLIDDVIGPALIDYAGELCLIGTPGPVPAGYFHECAAEGSDSVWSRHAWTFWDNPFIPITSKKTHQEVFDREMKRRGISDLNNPSVQREWFGKWKIDDDSLILHYREAKNNYDVLPPHKQYNYIMGVDVGFRDADAIAILAWSEADKVTYLIEEIITTKQDTTALATQIKDLEKKYKIDKIVMDMGALGKKIGEEFIRRWHIPVEPADKTRKIENLALLDDALRNGTFKAKTKSTFAQDTYKVEKDVDKSTPEKTVISTRFHSDIIDSVLYAFKISPAYAYVKPTEKPKYGTKEWADAENDAMWEKELEGYKQDDSYQKWLSGEEN